MVCTVMLNGDDVQEVAVVASTDASPMSVSEHCYARTVEYEIRTPVARYHSVLTRNSPLCSRTYA